MKNVFPAGVSVVTLVVISIINGVKATVGKKQRLANSSVDIAKLSSKDGKPIFGRCQYREMILAEICQIMSIDKKQAKQFRAENYFDCLVPLSNTCEPLYQPGLNLPVALKKAA